MTPIATPNLPAPLRGALVTLGVLVLFRLGSLIPLPGINIDPLLSDFGRGGATIARVSIFALGVFPLFTVALALQIFKLVVPFAQKWENEHPANALRLAKMARVLALALATAQALSFAQALEPIQGLVAEPGWYFRGGVVATLVGATALLGWLCDVVTRTGFCDGFWLLLIAPAIAGLPLVVANWVEIGSLGAIADVRWLALASMVPVLATALLVLIATAERRVPGGPPRVPGRDAAAIDVWPPLIAYPVASFMTFLVSYLPLGQTNEPGLDHIWIGEPLHLVLIAVLIAFAGYRRSLARGLVPFLALASLAAQIAICLACELVSSAAGLTGLVGGPFLIVTIALVLSVIMPVRTSQ